jgi:hypothetical protein
MHKSKLAGFIIDCDTDDLPAAARFWGAALVCVPQRLTGRRRLHRPGRKARLLSCNASTTTVAAPRHRNR